MRIEDLPTFVISLTRASERRMRMRSLLETMQLSYRFVDAVDGRSLDLATHPEYARAQRLRYFGRDMLPAELGCALSHKKVYQQIVDEQRQLSLVLEDDVVFFERFRPALGRLLTCDTHCFDLIRFFGRDKVIHGRQFEVARIDDQTELTRLHSLPGGAYAYLITLRGAQKLLQALETIDQPIDFVISRCWQTGLDAYAVRPHTVYVESEMGSDIGQQRFDKTPTVTGFSRLVLPLFRAAMRLSDIINKNCWYHINNWRNPDLGQAFRK